jgi:hypothetical protein
MDDNMGAVTMAALFIARPVPFLAGLGDKLPRKSRPEKFWNTVHNGISR